MTPDRPAPKSKALHFLPPQICPVPKSAAQHPRIQAPHPLPLPSARSGLASPSGPSATPQPGRPCVLQQQAPHPRGLPPPSPHRANTRGSSHLPQQLKFTTSDSCDRIKDEFQLLQAQYHSLKLECDKLASEKSEMQRHYVMYYEMSYGLNIEMHKQAEIVKRLNGICAQVLPYLSQEHQQQVLGAIERAKQVTAPELNSIIRQQLQAHQLSQLQALALPLTPLPVGLQPPSLPAVSAGTGLLSLSALGSQAHLSKEDKNGHDGDTHQEDDGEKSD
ncbi:Amino-terminal enhancer of split [Microtus ochrogaster]|uniref:Amino-terminal enhancer of split n=1 Tax=Microtus ochrogaster TaxID=79684 RepID=A0A8J6KZ23_MICOH|nr:Amino-terminal enhancer of split [Microtus ochrogaster]